MWDSSGDRLAQGPTVRKCLQAQTLMSGGLSPWLSFKAVLRDVPQRSARGPGKVSG